jgi:hypothetical protein
MDLRTPDITNSSALQLYHSAYRCHYELNDLPEACRLYREIIRQFPQSNECAYAVVQLEKIGANEVLKNLNIAPANKILPLAALIISLLALCIAGASLLLVLEKVQHSWYNISGPHYCSTSAKTRDTGTINAVCPSQHLYS